MGAQTTGPENSNFEKSQFYFFLKKGPKGPPKESKINFDGLFASFGPKLLPKTKFINF